MKNINILAWSSLFCNNVGVRLWFAYYSSEFKESRRKWADTYLEKSLAIINNRKENTSIPTRACLWYSTGIDIHIFSTGACRHDRDFAHHYPDKISLQNTKLLCIYSVVIWHMYKPFSSVKDLWRSLPKPTPSHYQQLPGFCWIQN